VKLQRLRRQQILNREDVPDIADQLQQLQCRTGAEAQMILL